MASGWTPEGARVSHERRVGDFCSVRLLEGRVWHLELHQRDNRFSPDTMAQLNAALDLVEARLPGTSHDDDDDQTAALLTTSSSSEKIFSNGLDLDFMAANPSRIKELLMDFNKLMARMFRLNLPSVCAFHGHAFAGGFMFGLAHDYRVMRQDRGFLCLNEVEINMNLCPAMNATVKAKLPQPVYRDAVLNAKRFTAAEALRLGVVDGIFPLDKVRDEAFKLAMKVAARGRNRYVYRTLKEEMYRHELHIMDHEELGFGDRLTSKL